MAEPYNYDYTFQELVDVCKNYIKTNCVNITNFAGIHASLKAGYSTTAAIGTGYTSGTAASYYTKISIIGNQAVQATAAQVDTDMANYLTSIGRTSLSDKINREDIFQFIEELMVFCYNHCWFISGQYATGSVFIYDNIGNNNNYVAALPKTLFSKVTATPTLQLLTNFTSNIKTLARFKNAKYRYTWGWNPASQETAGSTSDAWYIL